MSIVVNWSPLSLWLCVEFRRGQYYAQSFFALIQKHGFCFHLYADDSQVYGWYRPSDVADFHLHLCNNCIDDVVTSWLRAIRPHSRANRLQLNTSKLTCSGVPLHVDSLSCRVFHLGSALTLSAHRAVCVIFVFSSMLIWPWGRMFSGLQLVVSLPCASCAVSGARSRCPFTRHWLFCSLCRLDYVNATLVGIPDKLSRHVQSVLNTAARSVAELRRSDHITSFHWLCVPERIQFKLATDLQFASRPRTAVPCWWPLRYVTDNPGRRRPRSGSSF